MAVRQIQVSWELGMKKPLLAPGSSRPAGARVLAFIQARTTSTRRPNKIYADLNGSPILYHVVDRARQADIDGVVVLSPAALPELPDGVPGFWRGDIREEDVLSRFAACLEATPCDYVVRLTADCPLLDPALIDFLVWTAVDQRADYCSNVYEATFPDGVDVEVLSAKLLRWLDSYSTSAEQREHVTWAARKLPEVAALFDIVSVVNDVDFSQIKVSVDTEADLDRLRMMEVAV